MSASLTAAYRMQTNESDDASSPQQQVEALPPQDASTPAPQAEAGMLAAQYGENGFYNSGEGVEGKRKACVVAVAVAWGEEMRAGARLGCLGRPCTCACCKSRLAPWLLRPRIALAVCGSRLVSCRVCFLCLCLCLCPCTSFHASALPQAAVPMDGTLG